MKITSINSFRKEYKTDNCTAKYVGFSITFDMETDLFDCKDMNDICNKYATCEAHLGIEDMQDCCEDWNALISLSDFCWWNNTHIKRSYNTSAEDNLIFNHVKDLKVKSIKYDRPIPEETESSSYEKVMTNLLIEFIDDATKLRLIVYNIHNGYYPHNFIVRYIDKYDSGEL